MSLESKKLPTLFQALLPILTIAVFLGVGYGMMKWSIEFLLIASAIVTGLIARQLGYSYKEMEAGIVESVAKAMPAILVLISVGILIGTWIAAGTIPMLIAYGLKIISPQYFLITACLVCSIVSVLTGTSYGTAGTIGVVFMGIAATLQIPLGQAAGAVVAGAYFGDKISPFSDTTNLAPIASGSNLFDHVKHMLWTTTPAFLIGLAIYFFLGLGFDGQVDSQKIDIITNTLAKSFHFNILLLLPPAFILYFIFTKKPTVPGMLMSSIVAIVIAVFIQHMPLTQAVEVTVSGFKPNTGLAEVDRLLNKGGMASMMEVTLIAICAFAFAGIAQKAKMLDVLLDHLLKVAKTTGKLIATVCASSITIALLTGSSYLTILIPGELFAPAFKKMKLAAKNLSRTVEDSGTVIVPLIPWSIAGVYMSGTLGVPTTEYWYYAFMNYLGVAFALLYGFTGFAVAKKIRDDETMAGS